MNVDGTFKRIISEKWIPSASISTYMNPTREGSRTVPFSYNLSARSSGGRSILKNTPAANTLVTELAKSIFDKEQLGLDRNTDLLLLQYTVKTPGQIASPLAVAEQEDMYIRLDRNLQSLFSFLTSKISK